MTDFSAWIRPLAAPKPPPPPRAQLVVFRVGDDMFGADVHAVDRVLAYETPLPVAGAPAWVAGAIAYAGQDGPVVDLHARLQVPPARVPGHARLIVFRAAGAPFAAVADDVREVATVLESAMTDASDAVGPSARRFVRAQVRHDEQLVAVLDVPRLLGARDRKAVDKAMAESRT